MKGSAAIGNTPGPAGAGDRTRFLRFIAIGLVNTAFGYGVYAAFVLIGFPAQLALALQFAIGIFWNYTMHARFVFESEGYGKIWLYGGVYVLVYLANAAGLDLLMGVGVAPLLAQLLLLPGVVVATYVLLSRVFRRSRTERGGAP